MGGSGFKQGVRVSPGRWQVPGRPGGAPGLKDTELGPHLCDLKNGTKSQHRDPLGDYALPPRLLVATEVLGGPGGMPRTR